MEFTRVERPLRSPTHCVICKTGDVPCVEVELEFVDVATANGPAVIEGFVYVCLDRDGYTGCASQMAALGGGLGSADVARLRARVAELEAELATAIEEGEERMRRRLAEVVGA